MLSTCLAGLVSYLDTVQSEYASINLVDQYREVIGYSTHGGIELAEQVAN